MRPEDWEDTYMERKRGRRGMRFTYVASCITETCQSTGVHPHEPKRASVETETEDCSLMEPFSSRSSSRTETLMLQLQPMCVHHPRTNTSKVSNLGL
jgi:hypothetical protein